jgi:hypothetical protein
VASRHTALLIHDVNMHAFSRRVIRVFTGFCALLAIQMPLGAEPHMGSDAGGHTNQPPLAGTSARPSAVAPLVLYTDLVSGPNSGGENNQGAYLSIFGKNFGDAGLGSAVKVYIGGAEVAAYRYLGRSKGRPDIQQITVQVGLLNNANSGVALPINVEVNAEASNTDHTFMINPGRVLFVDNVHGNDISARVGDISHPYRHVQTPNLSEGAWGQARPGDIIVMRGTGTPWTDVGFERYFMRYRNKSGSRPTGRSGTGPIVLMGYPNEDTFIHGTISEGMMGGCVSAINGQSFPGMGQWAVIANLRIDCEGYDGPISQEIEGNNWRVVNNDLSASTAPTSGPYKPRMAGITGNGYGSIWLGNHIHDIQGSYGESHGIYIDGDGSYEIAYNLIERIRSGNGFQTYSNGSNGSETISNVHFHHNLIHDVSKHGINIADGSKSGFAIYDNIVYNTAFAGVRFNTVILNGALVYCNTLYNTNTSGNKSYGVFTNDWNLSSNAIILENNISWPAKNTPYIGGSVGFDPFPGKASHNLFYGGLGETTGTSIISADPAFIDVSAHDFRLTRTSPAIAAGIQDVASAPATDYSASTRHSTQPDLGAFAYDHDANELKSRQSQK